jgi:hypothetical protein
MASPSSYSFQSRHQSHHLAGRVIHERKKTPAIAARVSNIMNEIYVAGSWLTDSDEQK